MRIGKADDKDKVQIMIRTARRGKAGEKNSKGKSVDGKMVYETVDTFEVFDATAVQVSAELQKTFGGAPAVKK